jgi:hypothetical protein
VTISLQVDIESHIIMSFVHGFVTSSRMVEELQPSQQE